MYNLLNLQPDTTKHFILQAISTLTEPIEEVALYELTKTLLPSIKLGYTFRRDHLNPLLDGSALLQEAAGYSITANGRIVLSRLNFNSEAQKRIAKPNQINRMLGTYTGSELRGNSTRPGSMDAHRLPSLVCGKKEFRTKEI